MTKISNQYSLTNILTADLANSRLGINNVSPTVALDVTGAGKFSSSVTSNDLLLTAGTLFGAGNTGFSNRLSDTTLYLQMPATGFTITDNALNTKFNITSAGAATFSSSLTVNGFINLGSSAVFPTVGLLNRTSDTTLYLKAAASGFSLLDNSQNGMYQATPTSHIWNISNSEKMRITSAGNVGIGTSSPQSRLQAVLTNGVTFTPTSTGSIGGSVAQRVHVQAIEPGFMLSTDTNSANTGQTGTQTYSFGLQLSTYGSGDWRSQIYFGSTPLSFVYSGDQGVNSSERMRISTNGSIGAPNGTNIYNASDVRLKKNISTTTYGLDAISALNPVKFNWVDGFEPSEDGKDMLGFVAQEVQQVIPEAIESFGGNSVTIGNTVIDNPLRVNEKFIIPVLVKAIQELSAENTSLINRIEALENK
jgi:hypothetical protein